jgi:hypothetical protein
MRICSRIAGGALLACCGVIFGECSPFAGRAEGAELAAPKIQVEPPAKNTARHIYLVCLLQHTQHLAKQSDEPADALTETVFASCSEERAKLVQANEISDSHQRAVELVDIFDGEIKKGILLMVNTVRAKSHSS